MNDSDHEDLPANAKTTISVYPRDLLWPTITRICPSAMQQYSPLAILALCLLASQTLHGQGPVKQEIRSPEYWQAVFHREKTVDYPVIFVHGIGGGFWNWDATASTISGGAQFRMRYNDEGQLFHNYMGLPPTSTHWIWNVSYYYDKPVTEALNGDLTTYAERLREIVTIVQRFSGSEKVILISHSMGGLVSRAYMSLDETCWNSVHKIVTVAAPNEGVKTSIGIVGQLKDLRKGSEFIKALNEDWLARIEQGYDRWGVVGAIDLKASRTPTRARAGSMTDSGGIGYIEFSSSIPFDEWTECVGENFEQVALDTPHFGYRVSMRGKHNQILDSDTVYRIIEWSLSP